jgi:hypothetical protein
MDDVQVVVDDLIAKQKLLDAQDIEVGQKIVNDANPWTIDEAKRLAAAWIGTAAQESRNAEYLRGERDKLQEKLVTTEKASKNGWDLLEGLAKYVGCETHELPQKFAVERERAGEVEARLEMERREHDETRGYRQHTEKLLEDLHTELRRVVGSILLDLDDAMAGVDPAASESWRLAREKIVKLKEYA